MAIEIDDEEHKVYKVNSKKKGAVPSYMEDAKLLKFDQEEEGNKRTNGFIPHMFVNKNQNSKKPVLSLGLQEKED